MKRVSIHQPNYLPWLGYWFKIYVSDIFVFHDHVQFSKHSYTKRTKIRRQVGLDETSYLSVPVQKASLETLILDVLIDTEKEWIIKHLNQLKNSYSSSPHFQIYFPLIKDLMHQFENESNLSVLNEQLIRSLVKELEFPKVEFFRSSEIPSDLLQTDYLIYLIEETGGDAYLSGSGAKKYQDEALFKQKKIKLEYNEFYPLMDKRAYDQGHEQFMNGLSFLDALFNIGKDEIFNIFDAFKAELAD